MILLFEFVIAWQSHFIFHIETYKQEDQHKTPSKNTSCQLSFQVSPRHQLCRESPAGLRNQKMPVHPGRTTWNLKITQLKRKIIFQTIIFRFHVNLPGCFRRFFLGPSGHHHFLQSFMSRPENFPRKWKVFNALQQRRSRHCQSVKLFKKMLVFHDPFPSLIKEVYIHFFERPVLLAPKKHECK